MLDWHKVSAKQYWGSDADGAPRYYPYLMFQKPWHSVAESPKAVGQQVRVGLGTCLTHEPEVSIAALLINQHVDMCEFKMSEWGWWGGQQSKMYRWVPGHGPAFLTGTSLTAWPQGPMTLTCQRRSRPTGKLSGGSRPLAGKQNFGLQLQISKS